MGRVDVIDAMAKEAHISKGAAEKALDAYFKTVVDLGEGKDEENEIIQFANWLAARLDALHEKLAEIVDEGRKYREESEKYWGEIEQLKKDAAKYGF